MLPPDVSRYNVPCGSGDALPPIRRVPAGAPTLPLSSMGPVMRLWYAWQLLLRRLLPNEAYIGGRRSGRSRSRSRSPRDPHRPPGDAGDALQLASRLVRLPVAELQQSLQARPTLGAEEQILLQELSRRSPAHPWVLTAALQRLQDISQLPPAILRRCVMLLQDSLARHSPDSGHQPSTYDPEPSMLAIARVALQHSEGDATAAVAGDPTPAAPPLREDAAGADAGAPPPETEAEAATEHAADDGEAETAPAPTPNEQTVLPASPRPRASTSCFSPAPLSSPSSSEYRRMAAESERIAWEDYNRFYRFHCSN